MFLESVREENLRWGRWMIYLQHPHAIGHESLLCSGTDQDAQLGQLGKLSNQTKTESRYPIWVAWIYVSGVEPKILHLVQRKPFDNLCDLKRCLVVSEVPHLWYHLKLGVS